MNDCALIKKRLAYLQTLLTSAPRNLFALLSDRFGTSSARRFPWVEMIECDLCVLQGSYGARVAEFGDPDADADRWQVFIRSHPKEWKLLVDGLHFLVLF